MGRRQVALVRQDDYELETLEQAIERAFSLLGGMDDLVRPGMTVALKVNALLRKHPDQHATTHPAVVAALARALGKRGARVVIGDSPGGPYNSAYLRSVFDKCGFFAAAKDGGAEVCLDTDTVVLENPAGVLLRQVEVCGYLQRADVVFSLAKLKTHGMVGYTGAVKNMFGAVPGALKVDYHYRFPKVSDFTNCLVDICGAVAPVFSLIDGIWAMEGDGPSAGTPRKVGALVASRCPHSADIIGASLLGMDCSFVHTLKHAAQRGIVAPDYAVDVVGEAVETLAVGDFKMATPHSMDVLDRRLGRFPPFVRSAARRLLLTRPQLDAGLCIGCGVCMEACPPKVIRMRNAKPVIDRSLCIKCYCCQELCPKAAMRIKRPLLLRLMQGRG
ncbi:MAG: DUF362 domain-containing protein [Christensenellales bacterium]|jgi:uncharacterized protein (DUF362 family)/Pyruvate/2-oxoacid:ferredoxin oxidoreductase delta subunit